MSPATSWGRSVKVAATTRISRLGKGNPRRLDEERAEHQGIDVPGQKIEVRVQDVHRRPRP